MSLTFAPEQHSGAQSASEKKTSSNADVQEQPSPLAHPPAAVSASKDLLSSSLSSLQLEDSQLKDINSLILKTLNEYRSWIPDSEGNFCHGCHIKFQFLVLRKHHCRFCGQIFCDKCTMYRISCHAYVTKAESLFNINAALRTALNGASSSASHRSCKVCYDRFYYQITFCQSNVITSRNKTRYLVKLDPVHSIQYSLSSQSSSLNKVAHLIFITNDRGHLKSGSSVLPLDKTLSPLDDVMFSKEAKDTFQQGSSAASWIIHWLLENVIVHLSKALCKKIPRDDLVAYKGVNVAKQECPICFREFMVIISEKQEHLHEPNVLASDAFQKAYDKHVEDCLKDITENRLSFVGDRYSVFVYEEPSETRPHEAVHSTGEKVSTEDHYTEEDSNDLLSGKDECAICYDEFKPGEKVALLNCFCKFHQDCIDRWFCRDKGCPFHPRNHSHFGLLHE